MPLHHHLSETLVDLCGKDDVGAEHRRVEPEYGRGSLNLVVVNHEEFPSRRVRVLEGDLSGQQLARVHVVDELRPFSAVLVGDKARRANVRRLHDSYAGEVAEGSVVAGRRRTDRRTARFSIKIKKGGDPRGGGGGGQKQAGDHVTGCGSQRPTLHSVEW